jgi:CTP:molybdopterin cytidylyltransferase MocA
VIGSGYAVIVLAGDRGPDDPVARMTGATCKALSPVYGVPMLWRVIETLHRLPQLQTILVVGPRQSILDTHPELEQKLREAGVRWIPPGTSPSASAEQALAALPAQQPVLITTADHALLLPDMVTTLISGSQGHDLAIGMVPYSTVRAAYPGTRRTVLKLGPGEGFCGCNLFAVNTANGRRLITMWRQVETQRKHPARMIIGLLGLWSVLRYLCGRLSLTEAMAQLSKRAGLDACAVMLKQPEAAIDVDSTADLQLVESILANRG